MTYLNCSNYYLKRLFENNMTIIYDGTPFKALNTATSSDFTKTTIIIITSYL